MTGKTHVAIGVVTGLTISVGQSLENQLIIVLTSVIGSLAPDLDHPKAKLNQKLLFLKNQFFRTLFYLVIALGFIYLYLITQNNIFGLLGIMTFFIGISNHRGFTHSIVGFLVFSSIVRLVAERYNLPSISTGFIIGYISHLLADFFTIKGIKLFYPVKTNISSPILIRTNGVIEKLIFSFLSLYSVFLLYKYMII
ncbi:MAG: metal-dependent hydrolase [Tissierella sp.]|nr:metal-dependent hydrolase [Tissierella sp.]